MKKAFFLIICGVLLLIQRPCLLSAEETGDTSVNLSQLVDLQEVTEQPTPVGTAGDNSIKVSQSVDSQDTEEQITPDETINDTDEFEDYLESDENYLTISDPLEPINRLFFHFNDKLYFWVLKPAASGYKTVVPQPARVGVKNFFSNLAFPIRFVNCILQGKVEGAAYEFSRFLTNSIIGLAGFFEVAEKHFGLKGYDEDFGQTLGSYGLGNGFYINWPFLGPSSVRDTIGDAGDYFLDPVYYADLKTKYDLAKRGFEKTNDTSLSIGEYEDLKRSAMDPYVAFRDAYFQYRRTKVED